MAAPILTLRDIHVTFGSSPLLTGANLNVTPGERLCLVGRNGAGKSTLLKVAAGLVDSDGGERFVHPNASIRYLPQEADFSGFDTTLAYAEAGLGPADDPYQAQSCLTALGLTGAEDTSTLSGGEARRAAIARVLAAQPDVLLLDEPTNHLDLPAIEWLEAELKSIRSALVLISHDRRFLSNLTRSSVWIDRGKARRFDQGFAKFEALRDDVLEQEELELHKLDRKIVREDQWMYAGGVTGRRKRNMRRVAELDKMRQARREHVRTQGDVKLTQVDGPLSGKLVAEVVDISKSYDGRAIVSNFSTRILRGDRIGLVGPNGAGKTTLLNMLIGALEPDVGSVRLGSNLELVSLDQKRDALKPDWTVADALTGGRGDQLMVNGKPRHVVSYMKDFLFLPEQARSPLKVLSGGERGRLMLARALAKPSNLLVLDEPTNDLDLETLDLLQELLASYDGTVLLVSHDRDFLDRVVTSTITADGNGRWIEYPGGYSDMLAQRAGVAPQAGSAQSSAARKKTKKTATPEPANPQTQSKAKKKLSFKDKHALETLPEKMEQLSVTIDELQASLAEPDFYTRDPDGFAAATTKLDAAHRDLTKAEERWLELEMLREELEG